MALIYKYKNSSKIKLLKFKMGLTSALFSVLIDAKNHDYDLNLYAQ